MRGGPAVMEIKMIESSRIYIAGPISIVEPQESIVCDCCDQLNADPDYYDGDTGQTFCSDCWSFCEEEPDHI